MSGYKKFALAAGGLLSVMCLVGIPSLALADDDDNGQKVTICHIPAVGGNSPKTLKLPAHVAQRILQSHPNDFTGECGGTKFVLVAVSGTLEEGFPLRPNLDFLTEVNEGNPAVLGIFLGHALVRGVRAFLDIKDSNSREFKATPFNPINPALVASGNNNDANISSLYLVDRRQAARALLREPRYLSMVPDLAKVDIHAAETDPDVRNFILQAIQEDTTLLGPKNMNQVTLLQVISTWKSCHFVPSPVLYTKPAPDGARVTDFPNSLAAFAGVSDALRTSDPAAYNNAVEAAVRAKLALLPSEAGSDGCIDNPSTFPNPAAPDTVIRYGVDKSTKRMNDVYRPCQLEEFAARAGVPMQVAQCPN